MLTEAEERLRQIEAKIEQADAKLSQTNQAVLLLLSVLVAQQKDIRTATGVDQSTIANRILNGELDLLQEDGSRLNYFKLVQMPNLKKQKRRSKR